MSRIAEWKMPHTRTDGLKSSIQATEMLQRFSNTAM